jgi:hypothetical protein
MSATVTGTVNCFFGDQVNMFANITETVERLQRFARNPTLNTIFCTGTAQPWSVIVTVSANGGTLPLVAGPANVGAFGFDQTDFTRAEALGSVLLVP